MTTKQTATEAFIAKNLALIEMLKTLTTAAEDHFDTDPDAINWGHVGSLGLVSEHIEQACTPMGVKIRKPSRAV